MRIGHKVTQKTSYRVHIALKGTQKLSQGTRIIHMCTQNVLPLTCSAHMRTWQGSPCLCPALGPPAQTCILPKCPPPPCPAGGGHGMHFDIPGAPAWMLQFVGRDPYDNTWDLDVYFDGISTFRMPLHACFSLWDHTHITNTGISDLFFSFRE